MVRSLIRLLLGILILLGLYWGSAALVGKPLGGEVALLAHRGGIYGPENTIAAFSRAVGDGVDSLEFDVQMTEDGRLVVIHDTTVDRTTNGYGKVGDLTFDQIEALDAGAGEHVPLFSEVIRLASESNVDIFPEAKSPKLYPGIERAMLDLINQYGYEERVIVQSFDADTLDRFHELAPDLALCALYGQGDLSIPDDVPGDAGYVCPMAEMVMINPWMIRSAHADGRKVYVWVGRFESPAMLRAMLAFGADGLIVDDYRQAARVMGR